MEIAVALLCILLVIIAVIILGVYSTSTSQHTVMDPIPENTFPFAVYIINLDRKPERYEYVTNQLNKMGITNYQRWIGTDGFRADPASMIADGVSQELITRGKGLAGCASSHLRLWRHLVDQKADWTLILEDDAHFHPQFMELFSHYWSHVPSDAKIIFPGFCADNRIERSVPYHKITTNPVMCLHGYMLNAAGAQYLLDHLAPMVWPVDIEIAGHFGSHPGSHSFNGHIRINGIRPYDYKETNGRRCMFNGIIYQNHQEQGSTIHCEDTVF